MSDSKVGRNDAIITSQLFEGVSELLVGKICPDPQSFYNLATIVETIVLHEHLWTTGFTFRNPLHDFLKNRGLITETVKLTNNDTKKNSAEYRVMALGVDEMVLEIVSLTGRPNTIKFSYDNKRNKQVAEWLEMVAGSIDNDYRWWLNPKLEASKILKDLLTFTRKSSELSLRYRIPLYTDILLTPFRASYLKQSSISTDIYKIVFEKLKVSVDRICKHLGMKPIYIPPLMSILLGRCRSREEIPDKIIELREEFKGFREMATKYENAICGAPTLGEKIDILDEFEEARTILIEKMNLKKHHTKIVYRAWDIVKSGKPIQVIISAIDQLIDSLKERMILSRVDSFLDLWNEVRQIRGYDSLIQNVFRESFTPKCVEALGRYTNSIEKLMFPLGR